MVPFSFLSQVEFSAAILEKGLLRLTTHYVMRGG